MNTNPNAQVPPNQGQTGNKPQGGQVPDHRIEELSERFRRLEAENQQLRGQIDYMSRNAQGQQASQQTEESPFDPKVDQALEAKFQKLMEKQMEPLKTQMTQQVGFLMDRTDELGYRQQYGNEKFAKFQDKVDQLRRDYEMKGQYIPREEALKMVYFEETGRKAAPAPAPAQTQAEPKFDPYFGANVDPNTGMPVGTQTDGFAPQENPQTPAQMQPAPAWQQPAPTAQPVPQQTMPQGYAAQPTQHPHMNPYGQQQAPQLPGQGMNSPAASEPTNQGQHLNIDINASDAELAAFENKYGDIPL